MTGNFTVIAVACLATTGFAATSELAPASGHSIDLDRFTGVVCFTVERDGYRVGATLASGAEDSPIRFVCTVAPGQRMLISVPRGVGEPSLEFEVLRNGEAMLMSDPAPEQAALADDAADSGWDAR